MSSELTQIMKTPIERINDPHFKLIRVLPGRGSKPTMYIYEKFEGYTLPHLGDIVYTTSKNNIDSLLNEISNLNISGGLKKSTKRRRVKKYKKSRKHYNTKNKTYA